MNSPGIVLSLRHFPLFQRLQDGAAHDGLLGDGLGAGALVHALHRGHDVRLLRQEDRVGPRQEAGSHQVSEPHTDASYRKM